MSHNHSPKSLVGRQRIRVICMLPIAEKICSGQCIIIYETFSITNGNGICAIESLIFAILHLHTYWTRLEAQPIVEKVRTIYYETLKNRLM